MVNFLDLLTELENAKAAQSVAEADGRTDEMQRPVSPAGKTRDRMEAQRHVSARKAELQAKREHGQAVQPFSSLEDLSLEGQSLEGQSLEDLSLESPSLDAPAKPRQQPAFQQPGRAEESSSSDCNDWMEGFDIRRAVVWSEILRPKFKEDEDPDRFGIPY